MTAEITNEELQDIEEALAAQYSRLPETRQAAAVEVDRKHLRWLCRLASALRAAWTERDALRKRLDDALGDLAEWENNEEPI